MRDREVYVRAGRNDPLSPEQKREHPYDFVSLPAKPRASKLVKHDCYDKERLTGTLTLTYETLSPLHVGSGVLEAAAECGLKGGEMPVRGIVRRQGRPILPGSGWKGAVRARFEAITGSRLGLVDTESRAPEFKIPAPLRGKGGHRVRIVDPRVTRELQPLGTVSAKSAENRLSPADSLFGCMGYRGRVRPGDGLVSGPDAAEPLSVVPLDGPVMHRLAQPEAAKNTGGSTIQIDRVEGRKFYYDGDVIHSRVVTGPQGQRTVAEWIDYVPPLCQITLDVHLESITLAELGALLLSAGMGEGVGIVRFGGYKPAGLGKVGLLEARPRLTRGSSFRSWRRTPAEDVDLDAALERARQDLVDLAALAELDAITTRVRS